MLLPHLDSNDRLTTLCALLERSGCKASLQRVYRIYSAEHLAAGQAGAGRHVAEQSQSGMAH